MKPIEKIIIASVVGTSFMTLYSYWKSKQENEKYVEPELLNELIDQSENLPDIDNEESHPAGWVLHYVAGVSFVGGYWLLWRKVLQQPSLVRMLSVGALSGAAGIGVWQTLFSTHENPPQNNRTGYYKQLFNAHIVFSAFALATYKALGFCKGKK
ncbi:MAG: hypothetical protein WCY25_03165 [Moheibacter sp.]